ncbi:hypothetical protein FACS1894123_03980 [Bacteroidia bacterium]|nr:hypothetical protein FACS1894123_03980 [Bacteroidia bacterium]
MMKLRIFLRFSLFSLLVCLILFYIDEAKHSFDSIVSIDNAISLLSLTVLTSLIVTILYCLIKKMWNEKYISLYLSIIVGYPLGFFVAFKIIALASEFVSK